MDSTSSPQVRRAQNEKSKEYFSVVWRARRAVAGLASLLGVCSKNVRILTKKHRQKGFCKRESSASLRSATNLYWIFSEKEMLLSIRAKEFFSFNLFR